MSCFSLTTVFLKNQCNYFSMFSTFSVFLLMFLQLFWFCLLTPTFFYLPPPDLSFVCTCEMTGVFEC